jgi:hypothetical protein
MQKLIPIFFTCLLLASCSKGVYVVQGPYRDSPVPPAPDYGKAAHWAALPDKIDAADSVPVKSNLQNDQGSAAADVFFVHPTIFVDAPQNQYRWNADVNDGQMNHKTQVTTILNQATIFNGSCRVYAPYYRQAHLYSFYTPNREDAAAALELAYQDVRAAFEYYLKNFNQGRPIVIASHSQGSYHAERLIKDYFDGKELKQKLVAAYLVGRAIRPDAFTAIRPSEKPDETGVWASWNTFAKNFYPKDYERYYKHAQSTNPLLWNSSQKFAPKELNHGGVALHFTFAQNLADAQNHQGLLWINKPYFKGRAFIRTKRWHRADMNLFYMNIRENVALRVDRYLQQNSAAGGK